MVNFGTLRKSRQTMVLLLYGNSLRGAHVWHNIYYSTSSRHLITSRAVTNRVFWTEKTHFPQACATCNELPSNTMGMILIEIACRWTMYSQHWRREGYMVTQNMSRMHEENRSFWICDCSRNNQMPWTDKITEITLYAPNSELSPDINSLGKPQNSY